MWFLTYHWKAFDKGYNFTLDLTLIEGIYKKLRTSKMLEVSILGISGLPLGSPRTKQNLGVGLVARHRESYKGEGGGFPQVRAVVNLMNLCLLIARLCTKGVPTTH
jgi:hypothetical protein